VTRNAGVDGRRLVAVDRLSARRRLADRPVFLRPPVLTVAATVASALGLAALPRPDATTIWLAAVLGAAGWVVVGAPWRMFWRSDSTFLGRLPIAGTALYRLGTWRSLSAAAPLAVVLAVAALGLRAPLPVLLRHLAFDLVLFAAASLLAPATGAIAGALVVSTQSRALVTTATGQTIPPTSFLSLVPGVGAAALGYAAYVGTPWIATAEPATIRPLAVVVLVALVLWPAVWPVAARSLAAATRIVAALDAVKLAHVDLVRARGFERLAGRVLERAGRLVYEKDVALVRRRHPGYYILTGLTLLVLWIVAFAVDEPLRMRIVVAGTALAGAYTLVFARRLVNPPVERPRLLHTLPLGDGHVRAAKRLAVFWRALVVVGVAGAPALARASDPLPLAVILASLIAIVALAGSALAAYGRPKIL
jgi:hypothetical protein